MIGHHTMELALPQVLAVPLGKKHDQSAQRAALATLGTLVIDDHTQAHFPARCERRVVADIHSGIWRVNCRVRSV